MTSLSPSFRYPWMVWIVAVLFVIIITGTTGEVLASPDEVGVPYLVNFDPKAQDITIGYQYWAAIQDNRGIMYFGNTSGVVEYDGVNWRLVVLPGRSTARSLAKDSDGRIWVGGQGTFGSLESRRGGGLEFVSLTDQVPEEDRQFADIWKTHVIEGSIFFQGFSHLFRWSEKEGMEVFKPNTSFHYSFKVRDSLYVREEGVGLLEYRDGGLVPLPGGAAFADDRTYTILPFDSRKLLVGTRERGLVLLDSNGVLTPFAASANPFLLENQLYDGTVLHDGTFAFATLRGGVIHVDRSGEVIQIIDRSIGVQDPTVTSVFADDRGGLWLTLDRNITRVQIPSPLTVLGERSGIAGAVQSILRHEGSLFAATTQGVFKLRHDPPSPDHPISAPRFFPVEGIATQSWDLLVASNEVLAATNDGVFVIRGRQARRILEARAFALLRSEFFPGRLYVGLVDGLAVLERSGRSWLDRGRVASVRDHVRTMAEDSHGHLWLGTRYEGLLRVSATGPDPREMRADSLPADPGLGTESGRVRAVGTSSGVVLLTDQGVFELDGSSHETQPATRFDHLFDATRRWLSLLDETTPGRTWIVTGPEPNVGAVAPDPNGVFHRVENTFMALPARAVWAMRADPDGIVWLGTSDGLIRYDSRLNLEPSRSLRVAIRSTRVLGGTAPLYHGGAPHLDSTRVSENDRGPHLEYSENSLRFEYSGLCYGSQSDLQYRTFLEGFDQRWSRWSEEPQKEYTNLSEGKYVFRVKARLPGGPESEAAVFRFQVSPPWQRTWWAVSAFFLLAVAGMTAAVFAGINRAQRKAEITAANEHRSAELGRARSIQRHMLPTRPPDVSFLDIAAIQHTATEVGGDYYDFFPQPDERLYVAIGDATGHGLAAGLMVTATRTALLSIKQPHLPLVAAELNQVLRRVNLGKRLNMALTLLELARTEGSNEIRVEASGGGMAPLYIIRADGEVEEHIVSGIPLGALPTPEYRLVEQTMSGRDVLVLMSDGLPEHLGDGGYDKVVNMLESIGHEYRESRNQLKSQELLDRLIAMTRAAVGDDGFYDDVTCVVIRSLLE